MSCFFVSLLFLLLDVRFLIQLFFGLFFDPSFLMFDSYCLNCVRLSWIVMRMLCDLTGFSSVDVDFSQI